MAHSYAYPTVFKPVFLPYSSKYGIHDVDQTACQDAFIVPNCHLSRFNTKQTISCFWHTQTFPSTDFFPGTATIRSERFQIHTNKYLAEHGRYLPSFEPSHPSTRLGKSKRIAYIVPTMHDVIKDEQLMLQYKDGDSKSFEILYSRYRLPMFRYLQNQCGNAAIAEEIFQDVWMNLVRARERYEVTASFKTFIYRMAHNRLIDYYRKQKHGVPSSYDEHEELLNREEMSDQISPQRQVAVEQQVNRLLEALAQLPEAQREAFLLKEETGLSVEEIAEMTNVKPETAKSRIRYAMNKIKQVVEI